MTYLISLLIGWYGPNSELLGGVKLDIWHLKKIKDLTATVQNVLVLFAIDVSSFVINGILLWTTCKINVLMVMKNIQNRFWIYFAVSEAMMFYEVLFSFVC